ncbi:hypothetical protein SDC9_172340 [bioreactor metagenome]|uniref:Uncharacterized protein n=1 Tax=bioreactor metagenome TaxID=1076179 RepID=A0A645GLW5_9ZZZZ
MLIITVTKIQKTVQNNGLLTRLPILMQTFYLRITANRGMDVQLLPENVR